MMERRHEYEQGSRRLRAAAPRGALVWADLVSLSLAFLVAELAFGGRSRITHAPIGPEYVAFLACLGVWVVVAQLFGLYDRANRSSLAELLGVFYLISAGTLLLYAGLRVTGLAEPSILKLLTFWGLAVILVAFNRAIAYSKQRADR
jgi:hypothetical protein